MKTSKKKVRKPGDFRFGYDVVDANTLAEYEKILTGDVLAFLGWKAAKLPETQTSTAFNAWWRQKGALNFFTTDDMLRYRRELYARVRVVGAISAQVAPSAEG